jgi:hypothetical protein
MMLRGLIAWVLRLTACFALIGVLLSHEWGWSEYASDELYVVFFNHPTLREVPQYYIVDTDGSSEGERLTWDSTVITAFDCSPDGRALAFLTDLAHLYVITSNGLLNHRIVDEVYIDLEIANNQTVELYQRFKPSFYGDWLSSEQIFTYTRSPVSALNQSIQSGRYLGDTQTGLSVWMNDAWGVEAPLSPDGTKTAYAMNNAYEEADQIYIVDFLRNKIVIQLTHEPNPSGQPLCFLAFRPDLLIAGG